MQENCIFCKIAAGEIPSATIYEDEVCRVILDIAPAAKGHAILLPKKHFANIFEIDKETAGSILYTASRVAAAMKEALGCDGINLLQNNGPAAGQTVFHLHIHIIPRFENDGLLPTWEQGSYADGEAAEVAQKIQNCLK
ncbi:MAG: HIT family protein [Lachnospiraceae bacterium]|nr:HIT family protein [Lachnospiraceae bacterium]